MKSLLALLSLLLWPITGSAEEILREVSWAALQQEGRLAAGTVLPSDGQTTFARLRIENRDGQPLAVTVLTLERPPITSARYAITGTVRYEGVQGTGHLAMWSAFTGGERYFTKTLASEGLLQGLEGSSGWRPFVLPFFNREGGPAPSTLIVDVVLPGLGTVDLGPLRLVQYGSGEDPLAAAGQWWNERTGGLVGGLFGAAAGGLGGLGGGVTPRGRARGLVLAVMRAVTAVGIAALLAGLVAVWRAQPWAVYYPLCLTGVLCAGIFGMLLRPVRQRYEALELRKMRAADAG